MKSDAELLAEELTIINRFDSLNYTAADVYAVCDVVKAEFMFRAYDSLKRKINGK